MTELEPWESDCFIATACYGTELDERIHCFRGFRDSVLSTNILGRLFVKSYYKCSPPVADYISTKDLLRSLYYSEVQQSTEELTQEVVEKPEIWYYEDGLFYHMVQKSMPGCIVYMPESVTPENMSNKVLVDFDTLPFHEFNIALYNYRGTNTEKVT